MRKPTKLSYCTTCNTKLMILDTNGKPFRMKPNYCEVRFLLNNDTHGKLAFCDKCIEAGFDAEEAILNACDGMCEEIEKKDWSEEEKTRFLEHYEGLHICEIVSVSQYNMDKKQITPKNNIGEITNLFQPE